MYATFPFFFQNFRRINFQLRRRTSLITHHPYVCLHFPKFPANLNSQRYLLQLQRHLEESSRSDFIHPIKFVTASSTLTPTSQSGRKQPTCKTCGKSKRHPVQCPYKQETVSFNALRRPARQDNFRLPPLCRSSLFPIKLTIPCRCVFFEFRNNYVISSRAHPEVGIYRAERLATSRRRRLS